MQKHTWAFSEVLELLLQPWGVPTPSAGALVILIACFLTMKENELWGATASELEPLSYFLSLDGWAVAKLLHPR